MTKLLLYISLICTHYLTQAAVFLIDNMKWHLSTGQAVFPDSSLFEWLSRFDSLYTNMMLGISDSTLHSEYKRGGHWQYSYVVRQKVKYLFNVFTLKQDLLVFHKNAKFQMDNFRAYHKHFPSFFKRGRI